MAAGSAIIGSFDVGGELDKTLREADCGYCVPAGNVTELVDAIKALYNNPEKVKQLGLNARKYVETCVSRDRAVEQYINIIENMVNRK